MVGRMRSPHQALFAQNAQHDGIASPAPRRGVIRSSAPPAMRNAIDPGGGAPGPIAISAREGIGDSGKRVLILHKI
jgi:hypothetical protein